jgi:hypothetical protein
LNVLLDTTARRIHRGKPPDAAGDGTPRENRLKVQYGTSVYLFDEWVDNGEAGSAAGRKEFQVTYASFTT